MSITCSSYPGVSIPSSSGQVFIPSRWPALSTTSTVMVSIPSSSGQVFIRCKAKIPRNVFARTRSQSLLHQVKYSSERSTARGRSWVRKCLNPFFIRSSIHPFQTHSPYPRKASGVSIPSSSGQVFILGDRFTTQEGVRNLLVSIPSSSGQVFIRRV